MLKGLFAVLLLANAGLFAWQQGYLDGLLGQAREPLRMERQLHPERLQLQLGAAPGAPAPEPAAAAATVEPVAPDTPAQVAEPTVSAALPATEPTVAPVETVPPTETTAAPELACVEVGNFSPSEAIRFQVRLGSLRSGVSLARREVVDNPADTRYMVMLPPQGGRDAAEASVARLRQLGITDFFVIQDNSARRWGISLGLFRSMAAAEKHLLEMNAKGVTGAQAVIFQVGQNPVALQLRGLDEAGRESVRKLLSDFSQSEMRACE